MTAADEQRTHELLCAWLLEEASPAERSEVERAVSASPELAEERERLAATIALVRESFAGPDAPVECLSPEVRKRLVEAARARRFRRWYQAPPARLAAAAGLLFSALIGYRALVPATAHGPASSTTVARADGPPALADKRGVTAGAESDRTGAERERLGGEWAEDAGQAREGNGDRRYLGGLEDAADAAPAEDPGIEADDARSTWSFHEDAADELQQEAFQSAPGRELETSGAAAPPLGIGGGGGPDGDASRSHFRELSTGGADRDEQQESIRLRGDLALLDEGESNFEGESLGRGRLQGGTLPSSGGGPGPVGAAGAAGATGLAGPAGPADEAAPQPARGARLRFVDPSSAESSNADPASESKRAEATRPAPEAVRRATTAPAGQASSATRAPAAPPGAAVPVGGAPGTAAGSAPAPSAPAPPPLVFEPLMSARGVVAHELVPGPEGTVHFDRLSVAGDLAGEAGEVVALDALTVETFTALGLTVDELDTGRVLLREKEVADLPLLAHSFGKYGEGAFDNGVYYLAGSGDDLVDRFLDHCRRRPGETPSMMFFRYWGDNAFENALIDNQSTFATDVDTASYTLARNYLAKGHVPPREQVRTEEFVNFFRADVPPPFESTFGIHMELAPSPFGQAGEHWMLRVVVRGKDVERTERAPLSLTFVIDTSGSMKEENRLELVKHALRLLLAELDERDTIALVAFSSEARLVLPATTAGSRGLIESAIHGLHADGSTNAEAGLLMGYEQAALMLSEGATNRVVLLSDGVANVGQTDQDRITADVEEHRERGIYLNTIGVGMGNHNDVFLEQLANKGDGMCAYVDTPAQARRHLVEDFTSTFEPIARDVKVQLEFDPYQVESYRLLGYENRAIADEDFRNDAVDAGEVGAGHQVTALYELVRHGGGPDPEAPLATARLRWKAPHEVGAEGADEVMETSASLGAREASGTFEGTTAGFRRAVLVAQFAEFLRRSVHARGDSLDELIERSRKLEAELEDADFTEFTELLERSRALILAQLPEQDALAQAIDAVRYQKYLQAQIEDLRRREGERMLEGLEQRNQELEEELRKLLEKHLQVQPREEER